MVTSLVHGDSVWGGGGVGPRGFVRGGGKVGQSKHIGEGRV